MIERAPVPREMTSEESAYLQGLYREAKRAAKEAVRAKAAAEEAHGQYMQTMSALAFTCGCPPTAGIEPEKDWRWRRVVERDPNGQPYRTELLIPTTDDEEK